MKKKRTLYFRLTALLLLAAVVALDVAFFATKDRAFSDKENRNLQQVPALSTGTLLSGRYESAFETYVADQFPFRDAWIRVNAFLNRLMGKRELNGVFLAEDGYLIQNFTMPEEAAYRATMDAISAFSLRHSELRQYLMVVPSALTVCADLLPANAMAGKESAYLDRLTQDTQSLPLRFIDVRETLSELRSTAQVYYRTDHHWTTDAAYAAYRRFAEEAGLSGLNTPYEKLLVSDRFCGTLTAMSGSRTDETDEIYIYRNPGESTERVITYVSEGKRSVSFYDMDKLSTRDQYAVFFGGNHPLVKIENALDGERTLLVLKDSYANCFLPFLAADYKKIVVVDPRYYTDDLELLLRTEGVTDVLFLYNANTLSTDTSLKSDLAAE